MINGSNISDRNMCTIICNYSLKSLSINQATTRLWKVAIVGPQPSNQESTVVLFLVPSLSVCG